MDIKDVKASPEEISELIAILKKYQVDPGHLAIVLMGLMQSGFGRNEDTCKVLLAVIDIIRSNIVCVFDEAPPESWIKQ